MKTKRFIIIILLVLSVTDAYGKGKTLARTLERIDSALDIRPESEKSRHAEIDRLRSELSSEMPDTSRYSIMRDLYRLYRRVRCDSALLLAGERLELARRIGEPKRIQSASLNLAESYQLVGDLGTALDILDTIRRDGMEPYHLRYLYNIYVKSFRALSKAEVIPFARIGLERKAEQYSDSALSLYGGNDMAYYRIRAEILASKGHHGEALKLMSDAGNKLGLKSANDNALIAELYEKSGDIGKAMEYMSKAALIDLTEGTRTHASLMRLAVMLNDQGDYERAYRFIRVALDDASDASARGLSRDILEAVPLIDDASAIHERQLFRWRLALGITAFVMAVLLGIALWSTRRQLSKTRRAKQEASALNSELEAANQRLTDANLQRSVILNEFFEAYSDAIEQRKELRKHIGRLLKAGQRSMAEDVASSKSTDDNAIQDMYARFDRMVLSLYPEFAEEYDSHVPEKHRLPEEGLTSEARVLALMRLGITSSGEIARLLHYSSQTVYNYRSRLKSWGFQG